VSELKNCPFCGGEVKLQEDMEVCGFVCPKDSSCHKSGLVTAFNTSDKETAIAAWNRRAESAALTAVRERNGNLSVALAAMTAERDKDYAGMREMQAKFIAASQALTAAQAAVKRRDEVIEELSICRCASGANCAKCLKDKRDRIAAKLKEGA
jgi:Lar family restriction alleviation protein